MSELLAGRYRLGQVLGRGGMAQVFEARDEVLERAVAVKVMLSRFRDDQQFQQRFRREAQDAASLNHPNIVAVYDTGEQDGLPFIVMELVRGRSLRDAIAAGGLTEERALEVCADVCAALEYAHGRGLIHRDVKPGNILLSEDGAVKVTDFGIARAATTETVTQTAAVLGTAAYLSPEQAQGQPIDARSDVYSLGVVLYEVLTGVKPFEGDSAVTVAYQHVQEDPPRLRDFDPTVSEAAEAISLRALAKNPANRYQTAADFREDLLAARVGEPVSAPAVLHPEDTALLDPTGGEARPVPTERDKRRRRRLTYLLLALLTIAATAGAVVLLGSLLGSDDTAPVAVPSVVGQTTSEATRILEAQGLRARVVEDVYNSDFEIGRVVRQQPSEGTRADPGSTVRLSVSRGAEPVAVPEIVGVPEEEARAALLDAGLTVGERTTEFSEEVETGRVIASSPAPGETTTRGAQVDLVVSAGEETVRVRPVVGFSEAEAQLSLEDQGFGVLVVREFSDTVAEGVVIRQHPEAGTELEAGAEVTIVVSRGPQEEPSPSPSPSESPLPLPTETVSPDPQPSPSPSPEPSPSPTDTESPPDDD